MNQEFSEVNIIDELHSSVPDGVLVGTDLLQRFVTDSALIIVDQDVVVTYTHPDVEFSGESADANVNHIWENIREKRVYHLIVPDSTTHVTVDATDYSNPQFDSVKEAEAIVINNLGHRLLANFYMKLKRGAYPVRIFNSEAEAFKWFDNLRNQSQR